MVRTRAAWTAVLLAAAAVAGAAQRGQWGQRDSRNMVSAERDLPESFDPATGRNIRWTAQLGREAYGPADGRVYYGTAHGEFWVLAAGRQKKVLACIPLRAGMSNTPTASNGTLFVASDGILYAAGR